MVMLHIKLNSITKCSNMVANSLPADPHPPALGIWSKGQNSTFSEHDHVAYQIKDNHQMQQHGSKYFARRPLPDILTLLFGSKFNFSEHGHVAYQIEKNHECSNMVANILPADSPHS